MKTKTTAHAQQIRFAEPGAGAPGCLVAEVAIPITEGPLTGLMIEGIQIWSRKDNPDHLFVRFPGRGYQNGDGQLRTYEYLRAANGDGKSVKAVRERLLAAYREQVSQ